MKPIIRAGLFAILAVACLLVIVFAVVKSSKYQAPAKPPVTQRQVAQKLAHTPSTPSTPKPTSTPAVSSVVKETPNPRSTGSTQTSSAPTALANTGPSNSIALFVAAVIGGTALAYYRQLRFRTK